ncbi:MAG: replication-relaxation family protein [Chloroflexi bacterium]|uniref:replication-relaxation family protein n=1 Tax=Candidatus Flexifilum breve TaxID=3140694 RepID=UPI00313698B6|nr:replication-relaxation family protein [Chloroflexota bacterium]
MLEPRTTPLYAYDAPDGAETSAPVKEAGDGEMIPSMRLTDRDRRILEAVHAYDGILADTQIKALFFTGDSQMQLRTRLLCQHGYLKRPTRKQRAALTRGVYWLGERGAAYVAGLSGQPLAEFAWRKEPRWGQLEHDLTLNDVRIAFVQACHGNPDFAIDEWIPSTEFWAHPDRVTYTLANGRSASRFVRPDAYMVISQGEYSGKFLLEVDLSTEDQPRIARDKLLPLVAYLRSEAYKKRFGYTSGRILFVTTGDRRLSNLKRNAEVATGPDARLFYFTTLSQLTAQTVLQTPIWLRGGQEEAVGLFRTAELEKV